MIENKYPDSQKLEQLQTDAVEAPWIEVRGKRILIVEDQEPVRVCLRMMLELEGHQVTEASDGAEALKLFAISHFDLVITDFEMPVMKGNELAVSIKQLAPSLPILMITASALARRNAENPVDALLDKPFTMPDLHRALGKLLSVREESAQPSVLSTLECPSVTLATRGQIPAPLQV
jgi:CheY-like chemotaxis protein